MTNKKKLNPGEPEHPLGRKVEDLLPKVMRGIRKKLHAPGKDLNKIWPQIIGPKFAPYTVVEKINEGTLFIKVRSALALSHLVMHEQENILKKVQQLVKEANIKRVVFRR